MVEHPNSKASQPEWSPSTPIAFLISFKLETDLVGEDERACLHEEVAARLLGQRHRQPRRRRRVARHEDAARRQRRAPRQHLRLAQAGVADHQDLKSLLANLKAPSLQRLRVF